MIHGINPYTISSIKWQKFKRIGPHPTWSALMAKKNPIRGLLGCYSADLFDGCYSPEVLIYGSDGTVLKRIGCRSNDYALRLRTELNDQLSAWVSSHQVDKNSA